MDDSAEVLALGGAERLRENDRGRLWGRPKGDFAQSHDASALVGPTAPRGWAARHSAGRSSSSRSERPDARWQLASGPATKEAPAEGPPSDPVSFETVSSCQPAGARRERPRRGKPREASVGGDGESTNHSEQRSKRVQVLPARVQIHVDGPAALARRGGDRLRQRQRSVGADRVAGDVVASGVRRVRVPPVWRHYHPTCRRLLVVHRWTDDFNTGPAHVVRRGGAPARSTREGLGHDSVALRIEGEPERLQPCGSSGAERANRWPSQCRVRG